MIKHESERFTLYCADAADVVDLIEARSVGLIATDPPYGVKWRSNFRGERFSSIVNDGGEYDVIAVIGAFVNSALIPQRHVYVFGSKVADCKTSLRLGGRCDLVWDKGMTGLGDLALPWGPQHEAIAFGVFVPSRQNRDDGKGALSARLRTGSVLRVDRPNSKAVKKHPTEKPVELMQRIVESSSNRGDTVLDMFAGSGSTCVAAILSGRKAIGIEITQGYYDTALERCLRAEHLWRACVDEVDVIPRPVAAVVRGTASEDDGEGHW